MRRFAKRRDGVSRGGREELRRLHTAVVMLRAGASMFENPTRGGVSWYGKCAKCGRERWLVTSHILPVGKFATLRFDPDNSFAFCSPCHIFWWHRVPDEAVAFAKSKLGEDVFERLRQRADSYRFVFVAELLSRQRAALMEEWKRVTGTEWRVR